MFNREMLDSVRSRALNFSQRLLIPNIGYRYTINHETKLYPAAILYGTWSMALLKKLLLGSNWMDMEEKELILRVLKQNRLVNGLFYPAYLDGTKYSKSKEYMYLHCYNYSVGAALEIDPTFNFQSSFMDAYLNSDFLERWLNQRSLERPWEESNNIVNVASYFALCNDHGNTVGKERLYQMLEWHNKVQNPQTGGFENFTPSRKSILQSMAGSVHNFHIYHYLGEPMKYENKIANNVIPYLFEGPLTACLSIDFVELACKTINYIDNPYLLEQALLFHLNTLLDYQNPDGGWYENEKPSKPTTANGMKEEVASSNSYATWFRMCSIGMIAITLLGDDPKKWNFRKTLGIGYSDNKWTILGPITTPVDRAIVWKYHRLNLPYFIKSQLIEAMLRLMR